MTTKNAFLFVLGLTCATACSGGGGGGSGSASIITPASIAALTEDGRIVTFDAGSPGTIRSSTAVKALPPGESLLAIDARSSTGDLVGVSTQSRLYRIDAASGVCTPIGTVPFVPPIGTDTAALQVDPVLDDVRIITSSDRSFHVSALTGTVTSQDVQVQYAATDVSAGSDPLLAAIAFSDAHAFASQTTLYGIDATTQTLVRIGDVGGTPQPSTSGQIHTIGLLGITSDGPIGFDITPEGGTIMSASGPGEAQSSLYRVDISNGQAIPLGPIATGSRIRALTWRGAIPPRVFGITDQGALVTFRPGAPGALLTTRTITGLGAGETLVAIDQRVNDGNLYGISSASRLYRIDTTTSVATAVGGPFSVALAGTGFDLDFTPVFGAARIVDDGDQNLRVNPINGLIANIDQTLAYPAADPQFGFDPGVVAAAYDHNAFGSAEPTLFAIDAVSDMLVRIGSVGGTPDQPNGGMLNTIGPLGIDVGPRCGMDIDADGVAFASVDLGSVIQLCTIDLATGTVREIGTIGGSGNVIDIALETRPVPTIYGVDSVNHLVSFNAGAPSVLLTTRAITGLEVGEEIVSIDFRPVSGELLGVSNQSRVFRIDRTTSVATPLGVAFTPAPIGTRTSADVDPKTDELRVVSDGDSNLRVSTTTGETIAVDAVLEYAPGDVNFGMDPGVASIAHTQSFVGASSTGLYGIDASLDILVRQGAFAGPQNGQLRTAGPLGVDVSGDVGFDIDSHGLALVSNGAVSSVLFRVDLVDGTLSSLGGIAGNPLRDLAILPR